MQLAADLFYSLLEIASRPERHLFARFLAAVFQAGIGIHRTNEEELQLAPLHHQSFDVGKICRPGVKLLGDEDTTGEDILVMLSNELDELKLFEEIEQRRLFQNPQRIGKAFFGDAGIGFDNSLRRAAKALRILAAAQRANGRSDEKPNKIRKDEGAENSK